MRLFCVMPGSALAQLQAGALWATLDHTAILQDPDHGFELFLDPYIWMMEQMRKRGLAPAVRPDLQWPLWAWATRKDAEHHFRTQVQHNLEYWSTGCRLVELDIPDDRCLRSDYELWHLVLNNCNDTRPEWEKYVFDLDWRDPDWRTDDYTVQVTFWEVYAPELVSVIMTEEDVNERQPEHA